MEALLEFTHKIGAVEFPILMFLLKAFLVLFIIISIVLFVYDRYIQREDQLLINYPLIGRLRYIFYALRDPMRQYFGDEKFYDSFDKVKWVYNAAEGKPVYTSFSPSQPIKNTKFGIKNANIVLDSDEVQKDFSVTFGRGLKHPFTTRSIFGRSAMSDGAISPEGTRAFAKGAYIGGFPINTGEGSLTSNFLYTHKFTRECKFFETFEGTFFAKSVYIVVKYMINHALAQKVYKHLVVYSQAPDSYLFDKEELVFYRVNWNAEFEAFPKEVPDDIPDIIFQMGSGLYGVRDQDKNFSKQRYQKTMSFCRMTEIKIAQGAKQTGGKLLATKVSPEIAYYRGVEPYKDLFSPNQFPFAHTIEELFTFIGYLKSLSNKPVGIKIVVSSQEDFEVYVKLIQKNIEDKTQNYPDFITIDGKEGGSGAAPLEMMLNVGMGIVEALELADKTLHEYGVREQVKLIASEKVLTPDDAVILFAMGADYVAIARAFMMSAGCIRARECSGANGRDCPVGLATQNKRKRASFLVEKKAHNIANYHAQLVHGVRSLLAIIGLKNIEHLDKSHLMFKR
ncbi:FMN-binding glutamate synthase family protein [Sulfurimonas marina]|uniref:FMN-binding glutamate synthase family protein n=1 Tax=Sulfurimonas marina TaxID=2590551 RepID=A0A7M1AY07_9BACT|nr:FMN-binding glutamate synthase family protein [Sulfurimonas marina]QOP42216.1 FMN-binding glutamate synthase family protein [Sulfurimonas marina]